MRKDLWDDKKEKMNLIQHVFEHYSTFKKPLPSMHKDTLKRLALAWKRLKEE
jgi:hypothetical protein